MFFSNFSTKSLKTFPRIKQICQMFSQTVFIISNDLSYLMQQHLIKKIKHWPSRKMILFLYNAQIWRFWIHVGGCRISRPCLWFPVELVAVGGTVLWQIAQPLTVSPSLPTTGTRKLYPHFPRFPCSRWFSFNHQVIHMIQWILRRCLPWSFWGWKADLE